MEPGLSFVCYLLFRTSSVPSVLVVSPICGIRVIRCFPDLTIQRLTLQRGEANFPRNLKSNFGQYTGEWPEMSSPWHAIVSAKAAMMRATKAKTVKGIKRT